MPVQRLNVGANSPLRSSSSRTSSSMRSMGVAAPASKPFCFMPPRIRILRILRRALPDRLRPRRHVHRSRKYNKLHGKRATASILDSPA